MNQTTSRRRFLKTAAFAGVSLSTGMLARAASTSSDKLNHAAFGAYSMGPGDIKAFHRTGGINLVAVAEVDDARAEWLREAFPSTTVYKDWRVLLDKEGHRLDSVNVTTPDHMHAPIGVTAMKMGLHVYGQKPLGHSLHETRRMAEIARETGVVTQMGIQLSSSINERLTIQMLKDGVVGKIKEIHMFSPKTWGDNSPRPDHTDPIPESLDWDLWCGVAPKPGFIGEKYYHPGHWRKRLDYGCGTLGDMGCHIFSPMFGALGGQAPLSVISIGDPANEHNWGANEKYKYLFPGSDVTADSTVGVTWHGGSNRPPERFQTQFGRFMPEQGSIFVGTEGTLLHPHQRKPLLFPREQYGDYVYPELEPRDHYADFVNAARGEKVKPIADFIDYGAPLTEAVLLGAMASRFPQQTLAWDTQNLRVTNLDAANQHIKRGYRKGWEIDGLG